MVKKVSLESMSSGGFERKQPTEGVQEARILRVIDLGVRKQEYMGERKPDRTVLNFVFELADDKVEIDGKQLPMIAFKSINFVGGEKAALTKIALLSGIDPKSEIDFTKFLGTAVSLTLKKNEKSGKVSVREVNGVSDRVAQSVPPLQATSFFFDFDEPDPTILLDNMGPGMHKMLKEALNYPGSKVEALLNDGKEDPKEEEGI